MWYYIYYISYPVCMWMLLCCFHKLSHALNGRPVIHDNADMGGQHLDMWIALAKSEKPILIVQRTEQVRSYNLLWCWWLCCVHQLYTGLHPIWLCEWNVVAAGGVHVTTIYHSTNIITPRVCVQCANMREWLVDCLKRFLVLNLGYVRSRCVQVWGRLKFAVCSFLPASGNHFCCGGCWRESLLQHII